MYMYLFITNKTVYFSNTLMTKTHTFMYMYLNNYSKLLSKPLNSCLFVYCTWLHKYFLFDRIHSGVINVYLVDFRLGLGACKSCS